MVLDKSTLEEVKKLLSEMKGSVKLMFFVTEGESCQYCNVIEELLSEISGASNGNIVVEKHSFDNEKDLVKEHNVDRAPVIIMIGKNKGTVRFYGIPSGHEFGAFLADIIDASKGDTSEFPDELKAEALKIDKPLRLKVFITPQCPYCPMAVRAAHAIAMINPNVIADAVEAVEFPHWANKYRVRGVPKTVIVDPSDSSETPKLEFEGAYPPDVMIAKILGEVLGY